MSLHTFIDPAVARLAAGATHTLAGPEGRHAVAARRITVGEPIEVVDGSGRRVRGEVTDVGKADLTMRIHEVSDEPAPEVHITLVQALAKGGRDEAAIEAATELGVNEVLAWQSERSVVRWRGEKETKGLHRWQAILAGATKQSHRSWLPQLAGFAVGDQILDYLTPEATVLILHESAHTRLSSVSLPAAGEFVMIVGPEGGLSPSEVALLESHRGSQTVRLGQEVLRTSTAGPAALAVLNTRLGRW